MMARLLLCLLTAAVLLGVAPAHAASSHGNLGASCTKTSDCKDAQLECVTTDSGRLAGAGPAGGICTRECTTADDCKSWDTAATCFRHDDVSKAFCYESCARNNHEVTEIPDDHCHGRADVACAGGEYNFSKPLCLPQCTNDQQCGGLYCNKHFVGTCQADPVSGDEFGAACDHNVVPTTCAGYCSWYLSGDAQCSEPCIIGAPGACGAVEGEKADVACLGYFNAGGTGVGDLGSCVQLCSCDSDCSTAGFVCRTSGLAGAFGARGTCVPQYYVPESIPECIEVPEDLGACVYGELRACKGEDGCLGTAECKKDRSGYLECSCLESLGEGGAGGSGSEAAAGAPGEAGMPGSSNGGEPSAEGGGPSERNPHGSTPESGCDCRAAGVQQQSSSSPLAALLLALVALSRRRARS